MFYDLDTSFAFQYPVLVFFMVMISLRDMFAFLLSGSSRLSLAIPLPRYSWILLFDFPTVSFICFIVYVRVKYRVRTVLLLSGFRAF
jgi:hypothetical protein